MGHAIITRRAGTLVKNIENAQVELNFSSVTYDTKEHAPKITSVTLDGQELRDMLDYYAVITRQQNAGDYEIIVNGIGEYGGVKVVPWKIEKAKGTITVDPVEITIQGAAGTTAIVKVTYDGDGALTISESKYVDSKVLSYDPVFSRNNWQQIAEACAKGEVPDTWKIGDTKPITLTGEDAGEYNVQIIGFDQDVLDPTDEKYSDGTYNKGSGKAAITFQFVELLKTYRKMHTSNDNSCSWEKSDMRVTTMPLVLSEMPSDVKYVMRTVTKKAPQSTSNKNLISTADKLFLLGPHEVFKSPSYANFTAEGELYTYYASGNSTVKNQLGGSAYTWWLRCPATDGATYFCSVGSGGNSRSDNATDATGVATAFCI